MSILQKAFKKDEEHLLFSPHVEDIGTVSTNPEPYYSSTRHFVPDHYVKKILNHPDEIPSKHAKYTRGISNKLIHDVDGDTVMAKPYHRGAEGLHGWSSAVTPKLFASVGLGHLSDQVGVVNHNGNVLTVHKFEKHPKMKSGLELIMDAEHGHSTVDDMPHKHDLAKMAIMDFLTDQHDRHMNNFMVRPIGQGQRPYPMAIDNERAFGYRDITMGVPGVKQPSLHVWWNEAFPSWSNYQSALGRMAAKTGQDIDSTDAMPLSNWWMANHRKLKDTLMQELKNVTDESLREHIKGNFMLRYARMHEAMKNWASDPMENPFKLHDATSAKVLPKPVVRPAFHPGGKDPKDMNHGEIVNELNQGLDFLKGQTLLHSGELQQARNRIQALEQEYHRRDAGTMPMLGAETRGALAKVQSENFVDIPDFLMQTMHQEGLVDMQGSKPKLTERGLQMLKGPK
jgi:hypothetical protein